MLLYSKASPETVEFVREVMDRYHGDLSRHEVTVNVLMASDPDKDNGTDDRGRPVPMLKHGGYPAAATIKITPYKQRVQGIEDAQLVIDAALWSHLKPREREALIDHEASHLDLILDDEGNAKSDDMGRPKLRMRLHDVSIGVFDAVIRRHGEHAIDTQVVRACHERYRHAAFAWADDNAEADPVPAIKLAGATA